MPKVKRWFRSLNLFFVESCFWRDWWKLPSWFLYVSLLKVVPYCSCCCCAKFVPCHKNILDQRRLSGKYKGKPATEWNEIFISVLLLWFYSLSICFPLSSDFCQEKLDSAPDCPSPRRKLKTNPPPRGFEEFFAKLATDPLVKVLGLEKTCEFCIVLNTFFWVTCIVNICQVLLVGGLKALSVFFW